MLRLSLRNYKYLARQRWLVMALFVFAVTFIIVTHYHGRLVSTRKSYDDVMFTESYNEVRRKWYNFTGEKKWYNDGGTYMFDDQLLREIRVNWITQNLSSNVSYALENPRLRDPSMGQAKAIMEIFENKRNGFFIECGAYDGETRSNTLVLERFYGWSGILIEADPINFTKMLFKKRKAHMSPTCLSIKPYPMNVSFLMAENIGRIHDRDKSATETSTNTPDVAHVGQHIEVQCFPLASYVVALGVKTVDYFSLDVEGSEMEVLETIPFDRIDIKTLSVEYIHGAKGRDCMIDFMAERGYNVYSFVEHPNNLANDVIFVKREL